MRDNSSDNTALTAAEISKFKALLLAKRNEILGSVISMEDEALRRDLNNSSHMPIHLADLGSDNYQMEHTLDLVGSEKKLLMEIDDALKRIDKGIYGECQSDGLTIPKARLKAIPWTRFCINCAAKSDNKHAARHSMSKWKDLSSVIDIESDDDVKKLGSGPGKVINEDLLGKTD